MFVPQWDGQVCSLGYDVADWIEAFCCHGPGDVQEQPVELDAEWLRFIVAAYELDPRTGKRKVDRAVLSRPKGRAKSELAGFVAVAEAFGPVRFDGWDAQGQPIGRKVVSPLIKCLATEETQAGNTFENAAFIVHRGVDVHPEVFGGSSGMRLPQSATAIYLPGGGEMRATTSGAASKDGGKETFVVPDETHLYVTGELRSMYATVARNCGKRKIAEPWMLQTTTAYRRGQNSVAEQVLEAWRDGRLPNQNHWLVDHVEAVGEVNLKDHRHTIRQLRRVYGAAAAWMDLERIYRTMLDPTECETPEIAARYYLNLPEPVPASDGGVIPLDVWAPLSIGNNVEMVAPQFAVEVALDRETTTIAAAWMVDDQPHVEVVEEHSSVAAAVRRLTELTTKYGGGVALDGYSEAAEMLPRLQAEGLVVHKLNTGQRAAACGGFFDAAMESRLSHNGDPDLAKAVTVSARWSTGSDRRTFERRRSAGSIAPLYAVTFALHALRESAWVGEPFMIVT